MQKNHGREMFLKSVPGAAYILEYSAPEIAARLKTEKRLLDCSDCLDELCAFRFSQDRLPADAGGKGQCLRWAQEFTPLAWRNQEGRVIIVPQEAIDRLKTIL